MKKKYLPKRILALVLSIALVGGAAPIGTARTLTAYAKEAETSEEAEAETKSTVESETENVTEEKATKENMEETTEEISSSNETKEVITEEITSSEEISSSDETTTEEISSSDETTTEEEISSSDETTTEEEISSEEETTTEETTEDVVERVQKSYSSDDTTSTSAKSVNLNINGSIAGINNPSLAGTSTANWKGSYIYYGNYYQSNDITVKSPVKYRVLDNNNASNSSSNPDSILLLADNIMDVVVLDENNDYATAGTNVWENSIAKKWLNSESFESIKTSGTYTEGGVS
jgi:hypothetical protein